MNGRMYIAYDEAGENILFCKRPTERGYHRKTLGSHSGDVKNAN